MLCVAICLIEISHTLWVLYPQYDTDLHNTEHSV